VAARAATGVEQRTREVVGERIQAYLSAARAAIDAERYEEAERNLEQATLLQHSASVPIGEIALADSTRGAALARWQTLERERAELRLRLEQLPSADPGASASDAAGAQAGTAPAPDGEAERRRALTAALREKTADLQRYWTQLKEDHPDLAALVRGEPIEMRRVQSLLPADVLLLRYMILDDELVTVVVGSDALDAIRTPLAGADLRADVLAYHEQYLAFAWENADGNVASQTAVVNAVRGFEPAQRAAGYDAKRLADLSSSLYERLLAPVEEAGHLEGKRFLGISPNAALNYVPFAALAKRDGAALGERLAVFYFGGTSLLWGALDRAAQAPWSELGLVALGNPDGTLPGAETEVSEIGKLFGPRAQVLPREQATASALQAQADRPRVVHLAAHGVLDAEDPRASYIALADGPLTIDQVWRLPFEGVALTTLSACQTGVGPVLTGDEIVSLESAFVFAGSASVVASLWPVETRSTEFLMQRFYTHMADGAAKADALAAAQRDTRAEAAWAHPYYGSGFVLRGSWR
jgi:CHAT domain-containing protein